MNWLFKLIFFVLKKKRLKFIKMSEETHFAKNNRDM